MPITNKTRHGKHVAFGGYYFNKHPKSLSYQASDTTNNVAAANNVTTDR